MHTLAEYKTLLGRADLAELAFRYQEAVRQVCAAQGLLADPMWPQHLSQAKLTKLPAVTCVVAALVAYCLGLKAWPSQSASALRTSARPSHGPAALQALQVTTLLQT